MVVKAELCYPAAIQVLLVSLAAIFAVHYADCRHRLEEWSAHYRRRQLKREHELRIARLWATVERGLGIAEIS